MNMGMSSEVFLSEDILSAVCLYVLDSFTTALWFPMIWCIIYVLFSGANGVI